MQKQRYEKMNIQLTGLKEIEPEKKVRISETMENMPSRTYFVESISILSTARTMASRLKKYFGKEFKIEFTETEVTVIRTK